MQLASDFGFLLFCLLLVRWWWLHHHQLPLLKTHILPMRSSLMAAKLVPTSLVCHVAWARVNDNQVVVIILVLGSDGI